MDAKEMFKLQAEWHRMLEEEGTGESADAAYCTSLGSTLGAFLAFIALDADRRARLRRIVALSKSVGEAKQLARSILEEALSEFKAQPTVG